MVELNPASPFSIIGKTHLSWTHCGRPLTLEALNGPEDLNVDKLIGTLFMTIKDIAMHPAKHKIIKIVSYAFSQTSQTH